MQVAAGGNTCEMILHLEVSSVQATPHRSYTQGLCAGTTPAPEQQDQRQPTCRYICGFTSGDYTRIIRHQHHEQERVRVATITPAQSAPAACLHLSDVCRHQQQSQAFRHSILKRSQLCIQGAESHWAHQILARRRKPTQVCVRGINFADL